MAYCEVDDLLIGNIPLPTYLDSASRVQDAADEIDSAIGFIYNTPINVAESSPVARPARLLLKRINAHLASGRIILELAAAQEDRTLHAYGWSLIETAMGALAQIANREIKLAGATLITGAEEESQPETMLYYNPDSESLVDKFYDTYNSTGLPFRVN